MGRRIPPEDMPPCGLKMLEEAVHGGSVTGAIWVMESCLTDNLREGVRSEGMAWCQVC